MEKKEKKRAAGDFCGDEKSLMEISTTPDPYNGLKQLCPIIWNYLGNVEEKIADGFLPCIHLVLWLYTGDDVIKSPNIECPST